MGWRRERDERPPIDVVGAEPGDERLTTIAVGRSGPSRSKAPYVVALAVATLVGGLVLGGGGDEDDTAAAEDATTTTERERPERSTSTTGRDTTTTSVVVSPTRIDVRVVLLGGTAGNRLFDLGSGEITPLDMPDSYNAVALEDGVVVPGLPATYVPYDGGEHVSLGPADEVVVHGERSVWLVLSDGSPDQPLVKLVDVAGRVLAEPMRVDGWVAGAQGEGLILQGGGRIFRMEPDGTVAQLGIGSIRFVSDDHMVAWTCDERARCRLELWTPGSEPVVLGDGEGALRVPQSGPIEVSPDALHAAVLSFGRDGSTLTWVNLSDGSVIDLTSLATSGESRGFYISEIAWLPDDMGLIVATQSGLMRIYEDDGQFVAEELLTDGADRVLVIPG